MGVDFNNPGTVFFKNGHVFQNRRSETIQSINRIGTKIETLFNYAGCCPFVGAISGILRAALGKIQAVSGLALMAVGVVGSVVTDSRASKERFNRIFQLGKEHTIHGALNAIRGWAEVATSAVFGIGNLVFLIPNIYQDEPFSPFFFKYGTYAK